MSVIELKPHTLSFLHTSDGYEDDNGDWHEGQTQWCECGIECHAVAAGSANELTYDDGTTAHYTYTVGRLSPDCREFKIGERVRLHIGNIVREFTVKGFHRYQLQSKLWV